MMAFPALWLNALCHISFRVKLTILSSTALKTLLKQLGTMFDFITHWLDWLERGWFATTVTIQTTTKDQNSNAKTILYDFVVREVGYLTRALIYLTSSIYTLLMYLLVQTDVTSTLNFANSETITEPPNTKLTSSSTTSPIAVTSDTTSTNSNNEDTESSKARN